MEMIYDRGLPMREIGASLGISESRVCQLHEAIVGKLKSRMRNW
jgi:DNA-directed RNA polymerase specialized sigma subunit